MSETCYVTEVRLLTALEPLSPRVIAARAAETVSKARFSFASIPWPFLPQVPYTVANTATPQKEVVCINNNNNELRQRRLVSASAVSAANVAAAVTPQKLVTKFVPSKPSWPTLVFILLEGLRSKITKSLLGMAVGSALAMLVCETVTCLASLMLANKVPPGLMFMIAALGLLGYVAMQAIDHDSASISRRKTSLALLNR